MKTTTKSAKAEPAKASKSRAAARKEAAAIWEEAIAGLQHLNAVLAAGGDPADAGCRVTVRRMPAPVPPPPEFPPAAVKAAREAVGASQQVFADLLGASVAAVRAWERGSKSPSPMARRLLAEVAADPARWRARLAPAERA